MLCQTTDNSGSLQLWGWWMPPGWAMPAQGGVAGDGRICWRNCPGATGKGWQFAGRITGSSTEPGAMAVSDWCRCHCCAPGPMAGCWAGSGWSWGWAEVWGQLLTSGCPRPAWSYSGRRCCPRCRGPRRALCTMWIIPQRGIKHCKRPREPFWNVTEAVWHSSKSRQAAIWPWTGTNRGALTVQSCRPGRVSTWQGQTLLWVVSLWKLENPQKPQLRWGDWQEKK